MEVQWRARAPEGIEMLKGTVNGYMPSRAEKIDMQKHGEGVQDEAEKCRADYDVTSEYKS